MVAAPRRETLKDIMARVRRAAAEETAPASLRADALFGVPNVPAFSDAKSNFLSHGRSKKGPLDEALDSSSGDERPPPKPAAAPKRRTTTCAEDIFDSFLQQQNPRTAIKKQEEPVGLGNPAAHKAASNEANKTVARPSAGKVNPFQLIDGLCEPARRSFDSNRRSGGSRTSNELVSPVDGPQRPSGGKRRDLLDILDQAAPETSRPSSEVRHVWHTAQPSSARTPMNPLTARVVDQLNRSFDSWRAAGYPSSLRCKTLKIGVAFHVGVALALVEAVDSATCPEVKPGDHVMVLVQYETFCGSRIVPGSTFDVGPPFLALPRTPQASVMTLVASFCIRQNNTLQTANSLQPAGEAHVSVLAYDPLRAQLPAPPIVDVVPPVHQSPLDFHEGPGSEWFVPLHVLQELLPALGSRVGQPDWTESGECDDI